MNVFGQFYSVLDAAFYQLKLNDIPLRASRKLLTEDWFFMTTS